MGAINLCFSTLMEYSQSCSQYTSPNSIHILSDLHWQEGLCEVGSFLLSFIPEIPCTGYLGQLGSPNDFSYFISLEVKTTAYILLCKNFLQLYSLLILCTCRMKCSPTFILAFYPVSSLSSCPLFRFYSLRYVIDFRLSLGQQPVNNNNKKWKQILRDAQNILLNDEEDNEGEGERKRSRGRKKEEKKDKEEAGRKRKRKKMRKISRRRPLAKARQ